MLFACVVLNLCVCVGLIVWVCVCFVDYLCVCVSALCVYGSVVSVSVGALGVVWVFKIGRASCRERV